MAEHRWTATVYYHTAAGEPLTVTHDFDELADLHDLIERGPNFYAIERIVVRINAGDLAVTLEAAEHA